METEDPGLCPCCGKGLVVHEEVMNGGAYVVLGCKNRLCPGDCYILRGPENKRHEWDKDILCLRILQRNAAMAEAGEDLLEEFETTRGWPMAETLDHIQEAAKDYKAEAAKWK